MQLLDTSHGPVAYDSRGGGSPLILLSAGAHDHHDFDELRERLPGDFRSLAPDWPGHGRSPAPRGSASAMRFADVAEELVERLAPGGAIVAGNSVGGFSAARLAIRRPELVRGLVLIDAGGFLGAPPHVRAFCALMSRPGFLRRIYPAFAARYMRAATDADHRALRTGIATTRQDPGLRVVSELWASFASPEHDLRNAVGRIAAPTLLLWGRRDPVIPVRVGQRLERQISGARLVTFASGHLPHTTDPSGVAAELIPFARAAFSGSRRGEVAA